MSGLYQRALYVREQEELLNVEEKPNGQFAFDEDSGIPIEEQKEILSQLEDVVAQNKIIIDEKSMIIHPQKKGIMFPLLINLAAVLITVVLVLFFQMAFIEKSEEIDFAGQAGSESDKILKAVKDEANRELEEKEKSLRAKETEINAIQDNLKKLEEDKNNLQEKMQDEIKSKELELQEQMRIELDKKRKELEAQGISQQDITDQLRALEEAKQQEFSREIDAVKKAAEAERLEAEKELTGQISQIQNSLNQVNREKEALKQEMLKRTEELEKQLVAKEAELKAMAEQDRAAQAAEYEKRLEEEKARLATMESSFEAEKLEAESRLKTLSDQKQQESLINDQIIGMYNGIVTNISDNNLPLAKENILKLKDFYTKGETITIPGLAKRREIDLFTLNSLERLIRAEEEKASIDTASLVEKAGYITSIGNLVEEAEEAYKQNNVEKAAELYEQALAVLPDIKASYLKQIEIQEAERKTVYAGFVSRGDGYFKQADYVQAVENYKKALKMAPSSQVEVDDIITNMLEAGYNLKGNPSSLEADDKAAINLMAKGDLFFKDGTYNAALTNYVDVLVLYPRSLRVEEAKTKIKNSVTAMSDSINRTHSGQVARLNSTIEENENAISENKNTIDSLTKALEDESSALAALKVTLEEKEAALTATGKTLEDKEAALTKAGQSLENLGSELTSYKESVVEKDTEIEQLKSIETSLTGNIARLLEEKAALEEQVKNSSGNLTATAPPVEEPAAPALTEEQAENLASYSLLKETIESLKNKYSSYAQKEDDAVTTKGTVGYLTARPLLGEILNSSLLQEIIPGLYDRLKTYEDALVGDAKADGNYLAMDKILGYLDGYYSLGTGGDKAAYWAKIKEENKEDSITLELIKELENLTTAE